MTLTNVLISIHKVLRRQNFLAELYSGICLMEWPRNDEITPGIIFCRQCVVFGVRILSIRGERSLSSKGKAPVRRIQRSRRKKVAGAHEVKGMMKGRTGFSWHWEWNKKRLKVEKVNVQNDFRSRSCQIKLYVCVENTESFFRVMIIDFTLCNNKLFHGQMFNDKSIYL